MGNGQNSGSGTVSFEQGTGEAQKAFRAPDYNKVPFGDKLSDSGARFIHKHIFNASGATVEAPKRGFSIVKTVEAALQLRP